MPKYYMSEPNKKLSSAQSLNVLLIALLVIVSSIAIMLYSQRDLNTSNIHYCIWEDCGHQGQIKDQNNFVSYWGYEEMTDGWCVEMTHFINPEMTYEECDAYVFSGVE